MGVALLVWRTLMADLGHQLTLRQSARIFYPSQLGKYVPGSVWSIITQIELSRGHDDPQADQRDRGCAGHRGHRSRPGCPGRPHARPDRGVRRCITTGGSCSSSRCSWSPCTRGYSGRRSTDPAPGASRAAAAYPVLGRAGCGGRPAGRHLGLLGLQAWVLLVGWAPRPLSAHYRWRSAGYALAYSLGQLAVGLPAGAGVREAALTLALSSVVSTRKALVVALLSRAILTVVDLSLATVQYLVLRHSGRMISQGGGPRRSDPDPSSDAAPAAPRTGPPRAG